MARFFSSPRYRRCRGWLDHSIRARPYPPPQAMLLNDILGVERDIAEFGLAAGEDFGGLAVDTTELERTLDELVGPAALV